MMFSDQYCIPAGSGTASLRSKGSRFLGYVFPVAGEEEIKTRLNALRREFPDATHHCYAWVLMPDKSQFRANDDGEPGNSAGKPILREIQRRDLTNVLVVVVRYYGGTNLGIPGLIESYGGCAAAALDGAGKTEKFITELYRLECGWENESAMWSFIRRSGAEVYDQQSAENLVITVSVRRNKSKEFEQLLGQEYLISGKWMRSV